MAGFNGSGTFVRTYSWATDAAANIKIRADRMDTETDGIATGLSSVLCKDGQTTATARIPFAQGVSALLGSTSAVSYCFTGDTDTGIYSPAANKVGVVCGSTEIVRAESGQLSPVANNSIDLGSSTYKYKNGYFAGSLAVGAGGTFTGQVVGSVTALTSTSNSIAVDLSVNNNFSHTFTENTTLANPTNIVAGQSGRIFFTQHASSPKTLAFGSYWLFSATENGGSDPAVTATNSAVDVLYYDVLSTTQIAAHLAKGYA